MRQGGVEATFSHQVDASSGRIDVTVARAQDPVGASGTGLLAAVLFEPEHPEAIATGVLAALDRADELGERGVARAAAFTWARTAEGHANVYRAVIA